MKSLLHGILITVMAIVCVGGSCTRESGGNSNSQTGGGGNESPSKTGSPGNSKSSADISNDATIKDSSNVAVDIADETTTSDGDAMIIRVENDVRLRRKGRTDFLQIPGGYFHVGDLLRVGTSSAAFVDCREQSVCKLGAGDFTSCCGDGCQSRIALGPSPADNRTTIVPLRELMASQQQQLRASEVQIRAIGADEITTQFLMANLYSAWKVKEAQVEVDKFSEKLNDPQASEKLRTLYWPMVKRNGDLHNRMGNKKEAEQTYRKLTENPQADDQQTKADAHVSLGRLYVEDGRKQEAIQNLQKGQNIYKTQGNLLKAENAQKSINQIRKQKDNQ